MFEPSTAPRIFALPPGIRFAEALVAGLRARLAGREPEAMARVTLLLGSGRMLRAVRAAFLDQGAGVLPRLRLVEDIARDPALALPPPAPPLRQRLQLARLVRHLVRHKPGFAPAAAVIDLAESLRALFAEIHDEGVSAAAFEDRELALDHAAHWQAALAFIRIAADYFEDAGTEADAALRQRRAVERLAEIWAAAPPETPVLVAGSTGSRGTTRRLMEIVARLPQGAVILPGYDYDMPETVWNSLCSGPIPPEEHPQFRFAAFRRLLCGGGAQPPLWHPAAPPAPERNRVVSLALRPAPVTDRWMQEGAALGDLREAMRDAALVVAPSPRQEAAAIAIRLREAAEAGRRAALVTPDRLLARRVTAILDRWRITPDDSAGEPLAQSAPGRLLRQVAGLIGQRIGMGDLLALLKNPLVATGGGRRGEHMRLTRDLELRLRRKGPAFPDAAFLRGWAEEAAAGRDGAGEAAGEAAADRAGWAAWLIGCLAAFDFPREAPLAAFAARHLEICERLAAGPAGAAEQSELWQKEAGGLAREAMAELAGEAAHGGALSGAEYAALVTGQLRAGMVRRTAAAHPAIAIWGTLEARVLDADLVILGGLNEGVWPASPGPDPWLSRQMRQRLGLRQPERQTGLSAHDFQQAACAPEVVFTRARRSADAETVPSRWLARLTNLLAGLPARHGPEALAGMEARGARLLALADELDQPRAAHRRPPCPRPAPRPPVAARPRALWVTGIRTLIRDPYAIYAREILRLRPLPPLHPEADPKLRGIALHRIVEAFVRDFDPDEPEPAAQARFLAIAAQVLADEVAWPAARRLWLGRLERLAGNFVAAERRRALAGWPVVMERGGAVTLEAPRFELRARPDRIDLLDDGRAHVYDYKTGALPTAAQMAAFDKQLLLEAAMVELGGFAELGKREVAAVTHIRLGGEGEERSEAMTPEIVAGVWKEFVALIAAYDRRQTGYISRRAVLKADQAEDYDHLARYGEWDMTMKAEPEDVG